jgi:hypothetical protein
VNSTTSTADDLDAVGAETQRIAELEAKVAMLCGELESRHSEPAGGPEPEPRQSRRSLLRLTGAVAAGAVATTVAARPAAAATGGNAVAGHVNQAANQTVFKVGAGANTTVGSGLSGGPAVVSIEATDSGSSSTPGLRVLGRGEAITATSENSYGLVSSGTTAGVVGIGVDGVQGWATGDGYALSAPFSGKASLFLRTENGLFTTVLKSEPPTRTNAHLAGELETDSNGALWFCVASGTPGTWRRLAGPTTAGAFHAISPTRVYDSRLAVPAPGVLSAGTNRTVSIKDGRDLATGAVLAAKTNIVPAGATAIACNVTVIGATGGGFVTVNPGGDTVATAASVNWNMAGITLNNGIVAAVNPATREVTLICGGGAGAGCNVTLDVTGFWR